MIGIFEQERATAEVVDRHRGDERLIHDIKLPLEGDVHAHLSRRLLGRAGEQQGTRHKGENRREARVHFGGVSDTVRNPSVSCG